jgi:hypothetical protein
MGHKSPFERFLSSVGHTVQSVGNYVGPAAKPLIQALTNKGVSKIQALKTGGKARAGLAVLHKNEYVLPHNAKPTAAQKAIVAKNKKGKK